MKIQKQIDLCPLNQKSYNKHIVKIFENSMNPYFEINRIASTFAFTISSKNDNWSSPNHVSSQLHFPLYNACRFFELKSMWCVKFLKENYDQLWNCSLKENVSLNWSFVFTLNIGNSNDTTVSLWKLYKFISSEKINACLEIS